jgi:hypothetical protein
MDKLGMNQLNVNGLKNGKIKCYDDNETNNWISANTRECPKCHATISKKKTTS